MTRKKLLLYSLVLAVPLMFLGLFWASQVNTNITYNDKMAFKRLGLRPKTPEYSSFEEELRAIRSVQNTVFEIAPRTWPIAIGTSREPQDLIDAGYGNCNDRSRFLDKVFRMVGFETRYASIYETAKTGSAFRSLITDNVEIVRSHALVEVQTSRE